MTIKEYTDKLIPTIVAQYEVDITKNGMTPVAATVVLSKRLERMGPTIVKMIQDGVSFTENQTVEEYLASTV